MDEDILAILGIFFVTPLTGFGFLAWRAWLNKRAEIAPTALTPALQARFDALERQLDVVAVEVERLAEGQRFLSKVLVERADAPALRDGTPEG